MTFKKRLLGSVPYLASSVNPEELSLTIKGVIMALVPVASLLLVNFGISAELLTELVNGVFGVVAAGLILYGTIRKFKK